MKARIEILGRDKYGKLWYVLVEDEGDYVSMYVYDKANSKIDVATEGNHVMKGAAKKQSQDVVVGEELCHKDASQNGEWENRGIGKLLSKRIEKWAKEAGAKELIGFLSPVDDIDKLTKMYPEWGYEVKIYKSDEEKPKGYKFAVGAVMKKL